MAHLQKVGSGRAADSDDGPAYQDLENPNATLLHIHVDDLDTAMLWFKSDTFWEAAKLAKVTGRSSCLARPGDGPPDE
jgi:hypothetical protein